MNIQFVSPKFLREVIRLLLVLLKLPTLDIVLKAKDLRDSSAHKTL